MGWAIGIIATLVILWFVAAKLRGDAYVRAVVTEAAEWLRVAGEPEEAVQAFLNSMNASVYARSSFGKLPVNSAANGLIDAYNADAERWRSVGTQLAAPSTPVR
jgi:hypothetical protein